jgi:hypothetical protein
LDQATTLLQQAQQRGREAKLPYAGAVLPSEAHLLMLQGARLVDVRTAAELEWVGRIEGAISIEWNRWPGGQPNPDFLTQLQSLVPKDHTVMFLCRSGGRSHNAAIAAAGVGYQAALNILQGFEGDKNTAGQRNVLGGWRAAGLPWVQS